MLKMIARMKKIFLRNKKRDCLGCLMKSTMDYVLIIPVTVECRHSSKFIAPHFTRHVFKQCFSALCFLLMAVCYIAIFLDLFRNEANIRNICFILSDLAVFINVSIAVIFMSWKCSLFALEMNNLSEIVEKRNQFCIKSFISEKYLRNVVLISNLIKIFTIILNIANLIKVVLTECTYFNIAQTTIFQFYISSLMLFAVNRITTVYVYRTMLRKCYLQIKIELRKLYQAPRKIKLEEKLNMLKTLYTSLLMNLQIGNTLNFEFYLSSWLCGTIMVIIDLFILDIDILEQADFLNYKTIFSKIHLLTLGCGVSFGLFEYESFMWDVSMAFQEEYVRIINISFIE